MLVLATVACCNAVNMMDGQDGLAPGLGAIAGLGLAGLAVGSGTSSALGLAVAGASLGFLVWNRPPARTFLGDGGAYALGVLLVAAAAPAAADWPALLGVVLCLALFVIELTSTVLRRLLAASPALRGDRDHTYDRLAAALGSRSRSTLVVCGIGGILALLGQPVAHLHIPLAALLTVGPGVVLAFGLVIVAGRTTSLRKEFDERLSTRIRARSWSRTIPLARPAVADPGRVSMEIDRILRSGVLTNGPTVRRLEYTAASYLGVRHVVAVSSCTSGLMLVLRCAELTGDVVLPSFTFAATAHAVSWTASDRSSRTSTLQRSR